MTVKLSCSRCSVAVVEVDLLAVGVFADIDVTSSPAIVALDEAFQGALVSVLRRVEFKMSRLESSTG